VRQKVIFLFAGICMTSLANLAVATDGAFPEPNELPEIKEFSDPLVSFAEKRSATREQWFNQRRPELRALFQHYMYGEWPGFPTNVTGMIVRTDSAALGGKATLREVTVTIAEGCPPIHLLLVTPNGTKGPTSLFVGLNFCGNHAIVKAPQVRIPDTWMYPGPGVEKNRATEAGRGAQFDTWSVDQIVERGYALATFYNGDVDPDENDRRGGMRPFLASKGVHTATIAAWAWGVCRAIDYLTTLKEIDAKRIAVVGHSRLGKAALLAAAMDDRIALVIPHQAGCGGSAPDRCHNSKAETIERINTHFPHWFCDTFKQFNKQIERLPFDQHCLVALVAPRPVLLSNAVEDQWANPEGQFEILKAAEPAYRLLGANGIGADKMPEPGKLIDSTLGYYIRPGQHSMTRGDWKIFLDFADKNLKATSR
jgi:(4-O-methyl)-D-glucuronate---lignin esterase